MNKRLCSIAGGLAIASLVVHAAYRMVSGGLPPSIICNPWSLMFVAGSVCLAAGFFMRSLKVSGIGFGFFVLSALYNLFELVSFISLDFVSINAAVYIAAVFDTCALVSVCAACFCKNESAARRLALAAIVLAAIELVVSLAGKFFTIANGYDDAFAFLIICWHVLYFAVIAIGAKAVSPIGGKIAQDAVNVPSAAPMSAGELMKLHSLLEAGVLTEEEFELQKKKFVSQ